MSGGLPLEIFIALNAFVAGILVTLAVHFARAHFGKGHDTKPEPAKPEVQSILPYDMRQRLIHEAEEDYQKILDKSAVELNKNLEITTQKLNKQLDQMGSNVMGEELQHYREGLDELHKSTAKILQDASSEITKRQTEIDEKLRAQEAELQAQLTARTNELETKFKDKQAEYANKQAQLEAELNKHQAELEAKLKERETQLATKQAELEQALTQRAQAHAAKRAEIEAKLEQEMQARREQFAAQLDTKLSDAVIAFLTQTLGTNVDLGAQTQYLREQLEAHKAELVQEMKDEA